MSTFPDPAGPPRPPAAPERCPDCGTGLAPSLLACPTCARLVHGAAARAHAQDAQAAEATGDLVRALGVWRAAHELLPDGSTQKTWVTGEIQRLGERVSASGPAAGPKAVAPGTGAPGRGAWAGVLGVLVVVAFKAKFAITFLIANAKFLALGIFKGGALLPTLLSLGVFGAGFGWSIAGGLLASLYVHELGHVAWSRRLGIPVTPPMFIPGWGAFVRLRHRPVDAREDARIGLAGPVWGFAAALIFLLVGAAAQWPTGRAIAWWGATINVLNLVPALSLDGGRGFRALSRGQRGWVASAAMLAWLAGAGWCCALVGIVGSFRAADRSAPAAGDATVFWRFLGLLAALSMVVALSAAAVPPSPILPDAPAASP